METQTYITLLLWAFSIFLVSLVISGTALIFTNDTENAYVGYAMAFLSACFSILILVLWIVNITISRTF